MNLEDFSTPIREGLTYLLDHGYTVQLTPDGGIVVYLQDYDDVLSPAMFNMDVVTVRPLNKTESPFAAQIRMQTEQDNE